MIVADLDCCWLVEGSECDVVKSTTGVDSFAFPSADKLDAKLVDELWPVAVVVVLVVVVLEELDVLDSLVCLSWYSWKQGTMHKFV